MTEGDHNYEKMSPFISLINTLYCTLVLWDHMSEIKQHDKKKRHVTVKTKMQNVLKIY